MGGRPLVDEPLGYLAELGVGVLGHLVEQVECVVRSDVVFADEDAFGLFDDGAGVHGFGEVGGVAEGRGVGLGAMEGDAELVGESFGCSEQGGVDLDWVAGVKAE